jgi:hypothetical protein
LVWIAWCAPHCYPQKRVAADELGRISIKSTVSPWISSYFTWFSTSPSQGKTGGELVGNTSRPDAPLSCPNGGEHGAYFPQRPLGLLLEIIGTVIWESPHELFETAR